MKLYGATSLTLIEPIAARRELALKYGADYVIDPVNQNVVSEAGKITAGMGYDIVIEASGAVAGARPLPEIAARGGKVVFAAMYPTDYEMPVNLFTMFYRKELTMTGVLLSPYTFPRAVQLLERLDLKALSERAFYIDDAAQAFETHMGGEYPKVLILCNKDLENA